MSADDIEVIHMTALEWDQALTNNLNDLGLTWEQLTEQAKAGNFTSLKARQLWLMAGGQGPSQDEVEVARLRADVRAAYAERDEMWERKAAALQRAGRAEAERGALQAAVEQVRADCMAMVAHTSSASDGNSWRMGVYGQAKRTLNILERALPAPESPATAPTATS